jgi:ribosomal protein S18 acetylase RimI-like enzyme
MVKIVTEGMLKECFDVMDVSYKAAAEKAGFPGRGRANYTYEDLLTEYKGGSILYCKQAEGKITGIIRYKMREDGVCKISDIAVLPECQRGGYGKELLDFVKQKARELGAEKAELGMFDDNDDLKRWYEKNGFYSIATKTYEGSPFVIRIMETVL